MTDGLRWWLSALYLIFGAQRRSARRAEVGVTLLLAISLPLLAFQGPPGAGRASAPRAMDVVPNPDRDKLETAPRPSPTSGDNAPLALFGASRQQGSYAVTGARGCGPVAPAPRLDAGYFPRVVIPGVRINLEIHEGSGQSPPDHQWVAWHYPGSADPGSVGNTYVYAHAHGNPPNSASGLFWPLHYMHNCDVVYVYTSPTSAYRYQTVSVNLHWPSRDTRPLNPTNDDRITLQTCNAWGDNDPKTIVVAMRVDAPPPPPAAASSGGGQPAGTADSGSGGSGGGSGGGGGPTPGPTPPLCLINCRGDGPQAGRGAR